MHIKEIIVDGFKSYANRTVIEGFDPHFNAITGLNGSGKSNILDSICFVLGITNLSQVRAGNLSELVYKQGQAGVTKAVVTVVFDNEDEDGSPVGYEKNREIAVTRQVLIGGKSKYLINGHTAQAGQVQNLFHSVQLNVNNPHFLIMQGRITKVLNMKPVEILGMVEEAAGTRMYEAKKLNAVKTIEKKQAKVDELNAVLAEEITPTLERLRGEKQHYLKWSKNNADIERIERFCIAHEFLQANNILTTNQDQVDNMLDSIKTIDSNLSKFRDQIFDREKEMADLQNKLASEVESKFTDVKKQEEKISKDLVKANSSWTNAKKNITKAQTDVKKAEKGVVEAEKSVTDKNAEIVQDATNCDQIKQNAVTAEKKLADLQENYQNMCAGISTEEGDEGASLPEQISNAHAAANTADAKSKQAKMKFDHLSRSIKSVESDMKSEEKDAKKMKEKKEKTNEKVNDLQKMLSKMGFSEEKENELYNKKNKLQSIYSAARETVDTLSAQLEGRLSFNYSDPVRGFDRSKVKGLVAKLITVVNPKNATALEITAGGRLYQVVVDEAITGKALLANGKLAKRVTIIPLDKINARVVSGSAVSSANSIASKMGTTSSPAIELVGYDEEVRTAVEYVFGNTLIVDGMEAANKICDTTKTKTVTLQGDVFDPSGTISGGSNKNLGTTLKRLTEFAEAKKVLATSQKELKLVEKEYDALQASSKKFGDINYKLEIARAELAQVEKHMSQTKFGMLSEKFDSMRAEVDEAQSDIKSMKDEMQSKWNLHKDLVKREKELTKARENKLKTIDSDISKAKKAAVAASKSARDVGNNSERLKLELEALEKEVFFAKENLQTVTAALTAVEKESSEFENIVAEQKQLYAAAKDELTEIEKEMNECNKDLKKLNEEKSKLNKQCETSELESKKISVQIDKFNKDKGQAERQVANMLKKYSWISSEKEQFGVKDGDYDFEKQDPAKTSTKLKNLRREQETMSKKINKKVMGMIEKAEGEYTELLRKRKVVENDKKKIESVIVELDEKKKTELTRTWTKVNKDFGSIFTTLLPGAMAKLEPPEGQQAWEGLEVKVAFGGVWKQSLSELSGGQRSLLALSLILSMLLFKPAPMYILDEVDAALDLSHTQNIGNMLKTHFSQSQFIVVSLKEGMFNNANMIFRTKFVDGVSTVSKTVGTGSSVRGVLGEKDVNSKNSSSGAGNGKANKKAKTTQAKSRGVEN